MHDINNGDENNDSNRNSSDNDNDNDNDNNNKNNSNSDDNENEDNNNKTRVLFSQGALGHFNFSACETDRIGNWVMVRINNNLLNSTIQGFGQ